MQPSVGAKRPGSTGGGGGGGSIMDLRDNVMAIGTESPPDCFYVPIPDEAPRKTEQEKLSGVVKNLHRKLRRKYREGEQPRWTARLRCRPGRLKGSRLNGIFPISYQSPNV